ncbi:MAG: phage tail protein [Haloarculaceae archaeon]
MDFSYYATSTPAQWDEWAGRNLVVEEGGVSVATEPTVDYRDMGFDAVDVAVDRDGAVYALRPSGDVFRYGRRDRAGRVWANGDGETVAEPESVCLAGDRVFVADGAESLVVVSEREGRAIGRIETDVDDLRALVTGGRTLYLLDGGPPGGDGRIATLRSRGAVGTAIRGLADPRDLTVDADGNLSVLEVTDDGPVIGVYEARYVASPDAFPYRRTVETFPDDPEGGTLVPHCLAALSDEEFVVHGPLSTSGEPAVYHYRLDDGEWEPRHGLDVRCSRLRAGPRRGRGRYPTYYGVAAESERVYAIEETKKYRRDPGTGRFTATAFRRFDAGAVDTQWHRVALEFDSLDSNTQVLVSYAAADGRDADGDVTAVADVNEHDAADLRAAGIESLWDIVESAPERIATVADGATVERASEWVDAAVAALADRSESWTRVDETSPEDVLLSAANGRYLRVRLDLVGDEDTAPTVESFRAYCPRRTYLRYLPALFREDPRGERFLEQFLSVFESANVGIEEEIERLPAFFDPDGVPGEYLSWLEGWLALEAGEDWPESARREFLDRAPDLFEQRGTRAGIRAYVELYLSHVTEPDTGWILEWQRRRIEDRRAAGRLAEAEAEARLDEVDDLARDEPVDHHLFVMERLDLDGIDSAAAREPYTMHMPGPRSFAVFVGPFTDPAHREAVAALVAREKPAHTDGHVVPMRQHVKLEGNSFLGINTTLTPREFVLGRATLGEDSVLKERDLL